MHVIRTAFLSTALVLLLPGCLGRGGAGLESVNQLEEEKGQGPAVLSVFYDKNGATGEAIAQACRAYGEAAGVEIHVLAPGANYEETLKTRMASNSLPDVFTTHGWSVKRYAPYLAHLNGQPWADRVDAHILPLISGREGELYVLPATMQREGITYHVQAMRDAGVNPEAIQTWADFEEALGEIHGAGLIPMSFGGKDTWTVASMLDYIATAYFDLPRMENACAALPAGNFEWDLWEPVCQLLYGWVNSGYVDPDSLTKDYLAASRDFGSGRIAFCPGAGIQDAKEAYPDAEFGVIPVPVFDPELQEPFVFVGEDISLGVWKDTPYRDESLALLEYCARPEVLVEISAVACTPPGLSGVDWDGGSRSYPEGYFDLRSLEYFDRKYLPSGMWDDMSDTGALLLSGQSGAVEETVERMRRSYRDKMA